jgi:membrane protein DedA with SNARE-associated domain
MIFHQHQPHTDALAYVSHLSYFGFFFAVALSGYLIPIPEEIVLVLAGYLAATHVIHLSLVILACVLGAIFGDSLIYYLSGHGSRFTKKYHKKVEDSHAGWYIRHMKENPRLTIFFSRFIIGMRFLNPLVSGLLKVPYDEFIIPTALSAAIYIPAIILLGFFFNSKIQSIINLFESFREFAITALVLVSVVLIVLFIRNLFSKDE